MAKLMSTSALKARFEQRATESEVTTSTKCTSCSKTVYPMEKLDVEGNVYHKLCLKCETCNRTLGLGNYAALKGKFYCKPHLKQLFKLKGNYDEGFGRAQRKADWVNKEDTPVDSTTPEEVEHQSIVREMTGQAIASDSQVQGESDIDEKKLEHGVADGDTVDSTTPEEVEQKPIVREMAGQAIASDSQVQGESDIDENKLEHGVADGDTVNGNYQADNTVLPGEERLEGDHVVDKDGGGDN